MALDPKVKALLMQLTERLVRQLGTTTLMVTRSLEQATTHGDRLLMLHQGQLAGDWSGAEKAGLSPHNLREFHGNAKVS
jgi:putative ABC transport system ATP-binding protein